MDFLKGVVAAPVNLLLWMERRDAAAARQAEVDALDEEGRTAARIAIPCLHELMVKAAEAARLPNNHAIRIHARQLIETVGQDSLMSAANAVAIVQQDYDDRDGPIHELLETCRALANKDDPKAIIQIARDAYYGFSEVAEELDLALTANDPGQIYAHCQAAWAKADEALGQDINNETLQKASALCCLAAQRNRTREGQPTLQRALDDRVKDVVEQARAARQKELVRYLMPKAVEDRRRKKVYLAAEKRKALHRVDECYHRLPNKVGAIAEPLRHALETQSHQERHYWLGVAWYEAQRAVENSDFEAQSDGLKQLLDSIEVAQIKYASGAQEAFKWPMDIPLGKNPALPDAFQYYAIEAIKRLEPGLEGNILIQPEEVQQVIDRLNLALQTATPLNGYRCAAAAHHLLQRLGGHAEALELVANAMHSIDLGAPSKLDECFEKLSEADRLWNGVWIGDKLAVCKELLHKAQEHTDPRKTIRALALAEWHVDRVHREVSQLSENVENSLKPWIQTRVDSLGELRTSIAHCLRENFPMAAEQVPPRTFKSLEQTVGRWKENTVIPAEPGYRKLLDQITRSMDTAKRTIDLQSAIARALFCIKQLGDQDPEVEALKESLLQIEQQLEFRADKRLKAEIDRVAELSLRETLTQNWRSLIAWGVLGFFALHSPWHNRPRAVITIGMGTAILSAWRPEVDEVLHTATQYAEELTKRLMGHRYQDKLLLGSALLFPTMWAVVKTPVIGRFIQALAGFGVAAMTGNLLWRVQRRGYDTHHPAERKRAEEWKTADYLSLRRWTDRFGNWALRKFENKDEAENKLTKVKWAKRITKSIYNSRHNDWFSRGTRGLINRTVYALMPQFNDEDEITEVELRRHGIELAATATSIAKLALFGSVGLLYCMTTNAHTYIAWLAGAAAVSASSELASEITEHPACKALSAAVSIVGIVVVAIFGLIAAVGFVPGYLLGKWANGPLNIDLRKLCEPAHFVWWWNNLIAATVGISVGTTLWEVEAALFGFRRQKQHGHSDTPTLEWVRQQLNDRVSGRSLLNPVHQQLNQRVSGRSLLDPVHQQLNQRVSGRSLLGSIRQRLNVWMERR